MRSRLLAVAIAAGLGITGLTPLTAAAQTQMTTSAASNADLAQLKAQLAALQSKVDQLQQQLQQVQTHAVSAPSASDDSRLTALEKAVNDTTIGGKMYFDYTSIDQKNSLTGKTNASGTGIDVKRFYLSVTHQFDDIWSANLTTDFNYVSNDGETNLFVKKAYVQGKFDQAAVLRIGSADMPWIPFVENYYGYRYVENTLTDRLKYANSADWGINLSGDLGQGKYLNYSVSAVNGNGYKNPSRSNSVDFEGRVGFVPFKGMVVAVGGYTGDRGQALENVDTIHTAQRFDVMVAYAGSGFRAGGEYFSAKNWGNVLTPLADKADGYSFWGSVNLPAKFSLFARYDHANLSKGINPSAKDVYYNAGVQYDVNKGFQLALVYKHEKGAVSGTTPLPLPLANVKTDEVGVFGQVAF
ncbi:MAG TPA: porin [Rhodanobacter sp.]|nr:porin [Rhodanobacter sp.]